MEKIIERKLEAGSSIKLQEKLDSRMNELKKKFGGEEMSYYWGQEKKKLMIKSRYFTGEIHLTPKSLQMWIDIPFLFRPFKGKVVTELTNEINSIVNNGENYENTQQAV